ncbi:MAG: RnfABCDGE type electron transport complex subunit C [Deltaproteobacteria bacterium]|nr:MAG: RnfABCDGE type electron transport complex subunit C [Deltaproteobacteria bacterium]
MGFFTKGITLPQKRTQLSLELIDTPLPKKVILPVQQYLGEPATPTVAVGDTVKVGEIIATGEGAHILPLHATISGTVRAIGEQLTFRGTLVPAITIDGDGKDTWTKLPKPNPDTSALKPSEILKRIHQAGLITRGPAPVPLRSDLVPVDQPKTHLSVDGRRVVQRIDTLMITALDTEPLLEVNRFQARGDHHELPTALSVLKTLTGATHTIFVVDKHRGPFPQLMSLVAGDEEEMTTITAINGTSYPISLPALLIKAVLGREVPLPYGHPRDVGVTLCDLDTAISLGASVVSNRPPVEMLITVGGTALNQGGIVRVRIGTALSDIIEAVGGFREPAAKIITGGPLMGMAQYDLTIPLTKEVSGLFALSSDEIALTTGYRECINCGRCVMVCPVNLVPGMLSLYCAKDQFERAEGEDLFTCIECGCCDYVCPSRRPLVHLFRHAKHQLMEARQ